MTLKNPDEKYYFFIAKIDFENVKKHFLDCGDVLQCVPQYISMPQDLVRVHSCNNFDLRAPPWAAGVLRPVKEHYRKSKWSDLEIFELRRLGMQIFLSLFIVRLP